MVKKDIHLKFITEASNNLGKYRNLFFTKYREIRQKLKNPLETNYKLGVYHLSSGNLNDAIFRFKIVLYFQPDHAYALYNLAKCLLAQGKRNEALKKAKKATQIQPGFEEAEYFIKVIYKKDKIINIPINVIEEHFDKEAKYFNQRFTNKNGYKVPDQVANSIAKLVSPKSRHDILDIGCGTGRWGYSLAQKIKKKSLVGIDLSFNMLKIAKHHNPTSNSLAFDTLIKKDYNDFIKKTDKKFDIILAGLSLHFSYQLLHSLKIIYKAIKKDGILAFSVEYCEDKKTKLNSTYENFCYNLGSVQEDLKKARLNILSSETLKMPDGRNILVTICKK